MTFTQTERERETLENISASAAILYWPVCVHDAFTSAGICGGDVSITSRDSILSTSFAKGEPH